MLRPARLDENPDVLFGWRRGAHDDCPAFGRSPSVAHSGPVGPGTFVHFDEGRTWISTEREAESDGARPSESLTQVAAHEWGHLLGLGHVSDQHALMSPDAHRTRPGVGDLAGLHSLYGGGSEGTGDVSILSGERRLVLRRIAPVDLTTVGLFDTDGDGASELLVLRSDLGGTGALTIYRFAQGPVLTQSEGPFLGIAPPGAQTIFAVDGLGSRWIVTRDADGAVVRLRRFDDAGRLVEPSPQEVMAVDVETFVSSWVTHGDVDGDGVQERVMRVE